MVNFRNKEILLKIVYYGADLAGKTTNLEYIFRKLRSQTLSNIISTKTYEDRILYFDYFPEKSMQLTEFQLKVRLYTVPGEVKYNATRKLVVKDADGIVFVADSVAMRREQNFVALRGLRENLLSHGKNIFKMPIVMQYNKRDLENIPLLPFKTMDKELNSKLRAPSFQASALTGMNVIPTINTVINKTMDQVQIKLNRRIEKWDPNIKTPVLTQAAH